MTSSAQAQPAVQEAVASFRGRIADLRAQIDAAKTALTSVTATAQSADGSVRVTVDSSGTLTGIEFGRLAGITGEQLAAQVLGAFHDARLAVLDKAQQSVTERLGPGNPAAAVLAARAAAMRDQQDRPPGLAPADAASGAAEAEDIGYMGRGR